MITGWWLGRLFEMASSVYLHTLGIDCHDSRHLPISQAFQFAVTNIVTMGYGEFYPLTAATFTLVCG